MALWVGSCNLIASRVELQGVRHRKPTCEVEIPRGYTWLSSVDARKAVSVLDAINLQVESGAAAPSLCLSGYRCVSVRVRAIHGENCRTLGFEMRWRDECRANHKESSCEKSPHHYDLRNS
jgi:hypothetical protein